MKSVKLSFDSNIAVATYNLHGIQDNDKNRFPEIAMELYRNNVDICGFQEVVKSKDIEDTSYQIARHLQNISGDNFKTYWVYCHPFYDKYPEGISIMSRFPIENPIVIDLDVTIRKRIKPHMPRVALAVQVNARGRKILFITTHLDHHPDHAIRAAQASLLLRVLNNRLNLKTFHGIIITGDFNARDNSSCLRFLKRKRFKDTYRLANRTGGNTFPSCNPMERIDFIMARGKIRILNSYLFLYGQHLSDHIGIVTLLN